MLHILDHPPNLTSRLIDGLSLFSDEGSSNVFKSILHKVFQLEEVPSPGQRRGTPPIPVNLLGGLSGLIHIGSRRKRNLRNFLPCCRTPNISELFFLGNDPFPLSIVLKSFH